MRGWTLNWVVLSPIRGRDVLISIWHLGIANLTFSFFTHRQCGMGEKRKAGDASDQPAQRRLSTPGFCLAQALVTRNWTSHVTVLRRMTCGRWGHQTEDRVHSPDNKPSSSTDQQPAVDEVFQDPPLPDLEQLDNPDVSVPIQPLKTKRVRKNTMSVSMTFID